MKPLILHLQVTHLVLELARLKLRTGLRLLQLLLSLILQSADSLCQNLLTDTLKSSKMRAPCWHMPLTIAECSSRIQQDSTGMRGQPGQLALENM